MSSIRSLATITVLAGVGIFLYMKINETEPVLPEEVANFEIGELAFDPQPNSQNDLPQFGSSPTESSGSSAPAFSAAPQFSASAPSEAAPAFEPSPAPISPPAPANTSNDLPIAAAPPALTVPAEDPPADSFADTSADTASAPNMPAIPSVDISNENTSEQPPAYSPPAAVAQTEPITPQAEQNAQSSLFSATRLAVDSALDRGELSQALLLLSDWYDDPSLSAEESQEVNELLRQLAGTVIYSTEHRLEPPYMVQAGEQLEQIAQKYQVPWQLLAKINGITQADQLQPGQQLKVVKGPFSALIDLGRHKLTLMLDRRYAGQFSLEIDPTNTVEPGHWTVNQKLLTPGNVGFASPNTATEEPSLMLSNPDSNTNQLAIIRGSNAATATEPSGRVIRLSSQEVGDVYDILSLGSRVVIRR